MRDDDRISLDGFGWKGVLLLLDHLQRNNIPEPRSIVAISLLLMHAKICQRFVLCYGAQVHDMGNEFKFHLENRMHRVRLLLLVVNVYRLFASMKLPDLAGSVQTTFGFHARTATKQNVSSCIGRKGVGALLHDNIEKCVLYLGVHGVIFVSLCPSALSPPQPCLLTCTQVFRAAALIMGSRQRSTSI